MTRVYEKDTDNLFAAAFLRNREFGALFLAATGRAVDVQVARVEQQTRHRGAGHSGTIDLELALSDQSILLVENKIDAAYSLTRNGDAQPERYRASVDTLRRRGRQAASVLLAPEVYLTGSRHGAAFDHRVAYEALRHSLAGADLALLDAAILQASAPYEPVPNMSSAAFFADYHALARKRFPELVMKRDPNANRVRPTESRTIYFDVGRTLRHWPGLPRPRMSLQCRDSTAPSASVKIMLGGWAERAGKLRPPQSLRMIGGYVRPAGRSLGLVIDTPKLDTQLPLHAQLGAVEEGLAAARNLAGWWNRHGGALAEEQ